MYNIVSVTKHAVKDSRWHLADASLPGSHSWMGRPALILAQGRWDATPRCCINVAVPAALIGHTEAEQGPVAATIIPDGI